MSPHILILVDQPNIFLTCLNLIIQITITLLIEQYCLSNGVEKFPPKNPKLNGVIEYTVHSMFYDMDIYSHSLSILAPLFLIDALLCFRDAIQAPIVVNAIFER